MMYTVGYNAGLSSVSAAAVLWTVCPCYTKYCNANLYILVCPAYVLLRLKVYNKGYNAGLSLVSAVLWTVCPCYNKYCNAHLYILVCPAPTHGVYCRL